MFNPETHSPVLGQISYALMGGDLNLYVERPERLKRACPVSAKNVMFEDFDADETDAQDCQEF